MNNRKPLSKLEEITNQIKDFSTKELETLGHAIHQELLERDDSWLNYIDSFDGESQ